MSADLSDEREEGRPPDTAMMGAAQFDMMMAAHRRLFERVESINRAWLGIVQETSKSGSDLAFCLMQCKDPAEAQALCDAWLRDCARRLASFSRSALGSWLEFQRSVLASAPEQDVAGAKKSESVPKEHSPKGDRRTRPPSEPGKMVARQAKPLAETASP